MVRYERSPSSSGYSVELEAEAQAWVEEVTEEPFRAGFGEELRDGRRLCQLMNIIKPGSIRRINNSAIPFKQMENVSNFIKSCRAVGVPEYSLFETVDLFELKDVGIVVKCLHALGGAAQINCPDFKGPHLGLKAAPKSSPSQKWSSTTTRTSFKHTVGPGPSGAKMSQPGQAYPSRDKPTPPPTFNESARPAAPAASNDAAESPPPRFDESASTWLGAGENRLSQPPPYQKTPNVVSPSSGVVTKNDETEKISDSFSQALHVAGDTSVGESSTSDLSPGFSTGVQNGAKSPTFASKSAGSHRQENSGTKTPPYDSGVSSSLTVSMEPAKSFSPGTQTATLSPDSVASSANSRANPVTIARGGGYGLDAELAEKREANYDHRAEQEAQEWMEAVIGEPFAEDFGEELRNGRKLCLLINAIKPGAVRKVNESRMPFKQMENISNFLRACRAVGVAEHSLFETVDLFEGKDLGLVVRCLHALGQTIQTTCPEFNGPRLGIKHTEANKRDWTPEQQQQQARHSAGLISHVMAGSSKTMERGTIIKEGVTFGANTCGSGDTRVSARWTMGSQSTMERLAITKTGPTFGAEYAGTGDPHSTSSMFNKR